ncbi:MAG TPA: hypothetical protein VHY35_05470 [Stellaceae bacterium]|nr:hypothetical protein [Stellaceae bacterium]
MESHDNVLLASLQNGQISIAIVTHPSASMSQQRDFQHLPLIERIQRALVLLAYFIEFDGDVHIAMYEQFEKELEALKQREDTKARARHLLKAYGELAGLQVGFGDVASKFVTDTAPNEIIVVPAGRLAEAVLK